MSDDSTAQKPMRSSRLKRGSAIAAMATVFIGGAEGLRQTAYPDPATRGHPWTICYGHTGPEVHPGMKDSVAQCKELLLQDLDKEAVGIEKCVKAPLPDGRYVALLSLAHNIGVGGVCKSSVVRLLNEGNVQAGCDYLLRYNRAAGVVFPGLTRRREQERRLCLQE